ncbi:MAG: hypothetical protein ACP5O3_00585 [Candidatus Micrarchaeia archaeon]|jgi:hypothetical protein
METACPVCGHPLDVDAANSVVYCKNCGFAVHVDPNTGETQVLNPGTPPAPGQQGGAPAAYAGGHTILGLEPFNFWLFATAILLILTIMSIIPDMTAFAVLEIILTLLWLLKR